MTFLEVIGAVAVWLFVGWLLAVITFHICVLTSKEGLTGIVAGVRLTQIVVVIYVVATMIYFIVT